MKLSGRPTDVSCEAQPKGEGGAAESLRAFFETVL
jgi:hypothetical protein